VPRRTWMIIALALPLAACGGGGGASRVAPVRVISVGQTVTAELTRSDPRLTDNSRYHLWRFPGLARQTVQIDMMSGDFDSFLLLHDAGGRELIRNDDGGDGLNARIVYTLPYDGEYRIIANTYREGARGNYTLRVQSLGTGTITGGGTFETRGTLTRGGQASGVLTASDPRLNDNSVYHAYLYEGQAGETITIEVSSSEFDAYAIIQDQSRNKLGEDDDSGEGTDALLTFTLPYTGAYRILANAYRAGAYGRYTLRVR